MKNIKIKIGNTVLEIIKNSDKNFEDEIGKNLHKFNANHSKWIKENYKERENAKCINFGVYDSGKLVGGACGCMKYGWCYLEELWISEAYRKKHIGTTLIQRLEVEAKANNLLGIRTETWDFQARGFYEKNGFSIYAEFKDCPPGTTEYFLSKRF